MEQRIISEAGIADISDETLIDWLVYGLLVWTINKDFVFCYSSDKQRRHHDINPDQAQRLLDRGLIEKMPLDEEVGDVGQWHLSNKGWEYVFSRPVRKDIQ